MDVEGLLKLACEAGSRFLVAPRQASVSSVPRSSTIPQLQCSDFVLVKAMKLEIKSK